MAGLTRWLGQWGFALVSGCLTVAAIGFLWSHVWAGAAIAVVLQAGATAAGRRLTRRAPPGLTAVPEPAAITLPGAQSWIGGASLPGRLHVRRLNMRVNVGKRSGELSLLGDRLSLVVRGQTLDTALGVPLLNLTPLDGATVFPARPFLVGRGLGIQPVGGEAYYFFPEQGNREQILLTLQAAGFWVEAHERRPSAI